MKIQSTSQLPEVVLDTTSKLTCPLSNSTLLEVSELQSQSNKWESKRLDIKTVLSIIFGNLAYLSDQIKTGIIDNIDHKLYAISTTLSTDYVKRITDISTTVSDNYLNTKSTGSQTVNGTVTYEQQIQGSIVSSDISLSSCWA